MYNALDIAKYIVKKCIDDNKPISNLQLQKILYFIQVYYLTNKNTPLFDEDFEAWQFGPVIPVVYNRYSMYGAEKIKGIYAEEKALEDIAEHEEFDEIINQKRELSPWDLVKDTHDKTKAWYYIYKNVGRRGCIRKDIMRLKG